MNTRLIPIAELQERWGDISEALWPAIRQDPSFSTQGLYNRLMAGSSLLFEATDGAEGYWVVSLDMDGDDMVAWTTAIAGKIAGGPKQRVKTIRNAVDALEQTLVNAGVTAHRICGRSWRTILPHYLPFDGAKNGLEKRLI